jgi:hypothetical protein
MVIDCGSRLIVQLATCLEILGRYSIVVIKRLTFAKISINHERI